MFCQKSTFHRNFDLEKSVIFTFFLTKLFFQILIKNFSDHLCTSFFLQKSSLTFQIVLRKNLVDTANQWKNIQEKQRKGPPKRILPPPPLLLWIPVMGWKWAVTVVQMVLQIEICAVVDRIPRLHLAYSTRSIENDLIW